MEEETHTYRSNLIITILFFVIVVIGVTVYQAESGTADLILQVNDDAMGIACGQYNFYLPYEDVEKVEVADEFTPGVLVDGEDTESMWYGVYQREDFGEYQLFAYKDVDKYIIITAKDQDLVFNCSKLKKTEETYEELMGYLNET